MAKPRIAVIGLKGLPAFGGAAVVGQHLLDHMKDDFDFTIYAVASHTDQKEYNGVKQIVLRNFGNGAINTLLYYLQSMLHCLLLGKYDLIHMHHAESGFIVPLLKLRYPVVTTFHGVFKNIDPKFGKVANWLFRYGNFQNLKWANTVTSVSRPDAIWCEENHKTKVHYIPNGIDILKLKQESQTDRLTFAAGRIYEIKGLHFLLQAMKEMDNPPGLTVIGDTAQVPAYETEIMKLSEGLDVEYIGLVKDREKLFSLIASSKLFIFPSVTEAMSMMLLEVASLRTPIVASNIAANKAVFGEDELQFFETEDYSSLKKELELALSQPKEMHIKAEKAYERLCNEYTWDGICMQYSALYHNLL